MPRDEKAISILAANLSAGDSTDHLAKIRLSNLAPGEMKLTVYRIDRSHSWSNEKLKLTPTEEREIDVKESFSFQVLLAADSVTLILLQKLK